MAKISTYADTPPPSLDDFLLGTDVNNNNATQNFLVADLATLINSAPNYKVFTVLLTQSGGDGPDNIVSGNTVIGVTYQIDGSIPGDDFRNIGGPLITYMGEFQDYAFVATGTTPTVWTNGTSLNFNTGTPVAIVLENTIGNVWFSYFELGKYGVSFSNPIIDFNKVTCNISNSLIGYSYGYLLNSDYPIILQNIDLNNLQYIDGCLSNTPIEIRVYN